MKLVELDGSTRLVNAALSSAITDHYVLSVWFLIDRLGYATPCISDPANQYDNWISLNKGVDSSCGFGASGGDTNWYCSWNFNDAVAGPLNRLAHVFMAVRSDGSGVLMLNGVRRPLPRQTITSLGAFLIDGLPFYIGDDTYDDFLSGCMGDVALYNFDGLNEAGDDLAPGLFAKFRGPTGLPVDLGADGLLPGIGVPEILQMVREGETADQYLINRGTGGDFIVDTGSAPALSPLVVNQALVFQAPALLEEIWVDSEAGNDNGPGTELAPLRTLTRASASIGASTAMHLKRGSHWREQLDFSNTGSLGVYGSGVMPVIDGADVVESAWTQPDSETYPDVWATPWERPPVDGQGWLVVWADDVQQRYAASLADLQANGGCFFDDRNAASTTAYIKSATDPNTSGVLYEIQRRQHCINSYGTFGDVDITGPIEVRRAASQYNNISHGRGTVRKVFNRDGGIHGMVSRNDLLEDMICVGGIPGIGGNKHTFYVYDGTGYNPVRRRVFGFDPGGENRWDMGLGQSLCYDHTSSTQMESVLTEQCISRGQGQINSAAVIKTIRDCFIEDPAQYGVAGFTSATRVVQNHNGHIHPPGAEYFFTAGFVEAETLIDCCAYGDPSPRTTMTGSAASATTCAIVGGPIDNDGGPAFTRGDGGPIALNNCVAVAKAGIDMGSGTAFTGDYNVYGPRSASYEIHWVKGSTQYTTLATWQAATGQDAHSVIFKATDQGRGNPDAFWYGLANDLNDGPIDGDFRINPNAKVYDATDTPRVGTFTDGTPLTAAGPQEHWDWNAMEVVSGPPSRWPVLPTTISEMRAFADDPTSWDFYP